nr:unnamed protein product [Spirometra erinaceieuropaei]
MKNRSKNKKKQWRHLLTDLASDLHVTNRKAEISSGDFSIKQKNKLRIQKGDKEAAKDHPDIPTSRFTTTKPPSRCGKAAIRASIVDVWAEEEEEQASKVKHSAARSTGPQPAEPDPLICAAGQSYNPSIVDHQMLLFHAAQDEIKKLTKEEPQRPKKRRTAKDRKKPKASTTALKPKKALTAKQREKQMQTDLDNIPKILKEIKREEKEKAMRRLRKASLTAIRKREKAPKFPLAFQLPGEMSSSLRKLRADENWAREVEFKRNKLPRARKTLGITKTTTSFVRRK